jgi:hypothetical protein
MRREEMQSLSLHRDEKFRTRRQQYGTLINTLVLPYVDRVHIHSGTSVLCI